MYGLINEIDGILRKLYQVAEPKEQQTVCNVAKDKIFSLLVLIKTNDTLKDNRKYFHMLYQCIIRNMDILLFNSKQVNLLLEILHKGEEDSTLFNSYEYYSYNEKLYNHGLECFPSEDSNM